jgi:hypothetical protein
MKTLLTLAAVVCLWLALDSGLGPKLKGALAAGLRSALEALEEEQPEQQQVPWDFGGPQPQPQATGFWGREPQPQPQSSWGWGQPTEREQSMWTPSPRHHRRSSF